MNLTNVKAYWIKTRNDGKCALCGSNIGYCHIGEFCTNEECPYVDGWARLTEEQLEKFKDVVIEGVIYPAFKKE